MDRVLVLWIFQYLSPTREYYARSYNLFFYFASAFKFLYIHICTGCPRRNVPDFGRDLYIYIYMYRVSQEECARLLEGVPYVKVYRYNPKHLYPKLNGYGDNGQRSLKL